MGEIIDLESFRRKRKRRAQESRAGRPREETKGLPARLPARPTGERSGTGRNDPAPGGRIDPSDNKTGK